MSKLQRIGESNEEFILRMKFEIDEINSRMRRDAAKFAASIGLCFWFIHIGAKYQLTSDWIMVPMVLLIPNIYFDLFDLGSWIQRKFKP